MALTRDDISEALAAYWGRKDLQNENSRIAGKVGAGTAGSVRGGHQFDPVAATLAKPFIEGGYAPHDVRIEGKLTLPGYYRPSKDWDVIITNRGTVAAAFELKALGGPSFGNNANNRIEEALGSATDTHQACVDGRFGAELPWLGYLIVVEDHAKSRRPSRPKSVVAGDLDPAWVGSSYQQRIALGVERMVAQRVYDAACVLVSNKTDPGPLRAVARRRLGPLHSSHQRPNRIPERSRHSEVSAHSLGSPHHEPLAAPWRWWSSTVVPVRMRGHER